MVEQRITAGEGPEAPLGGAALLAPFLRARLGLGQPHLPKTFLRSQQGWRPPQDVDTVHLHLPDTTTGTVPVRLYRPRGITGGLPGLVWFHGGGFTHGSLDWGEAHALALELASHARIIVASVGYATSSYPDALRDARHAWAWLASAGELLGMAGVPAAGGASAGASLALSASVAERTPGTPAATAFLGLYGLYHARIPAPDPTTARALADLPAGVRFDTAAYARWVQTVREDLDDPNALDPGALPLTEMPPTALVECQYDDLRASTSTLARTLRESGVIVRELCVDGVVHGHLNWLPGADLPQVETTLTFLEDALRDLPQPNTEAPVAVTKE